MKEKSGGYWLRLTACFILALVIVLAGLPLVLGFLMIRGLIYPPCADLALTPGDYGFAYEDITLPARAGGSFRGYFVPGNNGTAIIVVPGFNSGRAGRLREAMLLARHGYGLFAFESRRCAGMAGWKRKTSRCCDFGMQNCAKKSSPYAIRFGISCRSAPHIPCPIIAGRCARR